MSEHIHGHPASHKKTKPEPHTQESSWQLGPRQDVQLSVCPVPLHTGLNWAEGNAALAGVWVCVCCACVCCRIDLLKDKVLSTHSHLSHILNTF